MWQVLYKCKLLLLSLLLLVVVVVIVEIIVVVVVTVVVIVGVMVVQCCIQTNFSLFQVKENPPDYKKYYRQMSKVLKAYIQF